MSGDTLAVLAVALAASWASGVNAYAAVLVLGIAQRLGFVTLPQDLQVLGGIGDADSGLFGKGFYGARALAQQLQQLDPLGRRGGFPNAGKLFIHTILQLTCVHLSLPPSIQVFS